MTYADYLLKRKKLAEERKAAPAPLPIEEPAAATPTEASVRATSSLRIRSESPPAAALSSQSVGENVRALPAPPRQRSITPSRGVPQRPLSLLPNDKEGPEQRVALLDASFSHGGEDAELPAWQPPPAFLLLEGKETSLGLGAGFGSPSRSPPSQGLLAAGPGSPTLLRANPTSRSRSASGYSARSRSPSNYSRGSHGGSGSRSRGGGGEANESAVQPYLSSTSQAGPIWRQASPPRDKRDETMRFAKALLRLRERNAIGPHLMLRPAHIAGEQVVPHGDIMGYLGMFVSAASTNTVVAEGEARYGERGLVGEYGSRSSSPSGWGRGYEGYESSNPGSPSRRSGALTSHSGDRAEASESRPTSRTHFSKDDYTGLKQPKTGGRSASPADGPLRRTRPKSPLHELREARDQREYTSATVEYREASPKPLRKSPRDVCGEAAPPVVPRPAPRPPPEAGGGPVTTTTQHWVATGQHPPSASHGVPPGGSSVGVVDPESLFPAQIGAGMGQPETWDPNRAPIGQRSFPAARRSSSPGPPPSVQRTRGGQGGRPRQGSHGSTGTTTQAARTHSHTHAHTQLRSHPPPEASSLSTRNGSVCSGVTQWRAVLQGPGSSQAGSDAGGELPMVVDLGSSRGHSRGPTPRSHPGGGWQDHHGASLGPEAAFSELDLNRDGVISKEEFMEGIHRNAVMLVSGGNLETTHHSAPPVPQLPGGGFAQGATHTEILQYPPGHEAEMAERVRRRVISMKKTGPPPSNPPR